MRVCHPSKLVNSRRVCHDAHVSRDPGPRAPGGFGRGRSPEKHERRARSRPKARRSATPVQHKGSEMEPLGSALHRANTADKARAAAARAAEATIAAGISSRMPQSSRDNAVPAEPVTPGATPVAPPAVDPAFSAFLDRTEEWAVARERKTEEKRLAQERRES